MEINLLFAGTGILLTAAVSLAAWNNITSRKWYYFLTLIYVISFLIVIMTDSWLYFIIGWEMVTLTTALMLVWSGKDIAWKYFIIQFIGGSFLLYTILVASTNGYSQVGPIEETWLQNMFIIGLGVKSALFGLHFWIPMVYARASTIFCALSSGWVVKLGFITYLRILTGRSNLLIILGLLMIIYGGIRALLADDYKILLGYSSISQLGYIAVGVGSGTVYGYIGAVFHIIAHGLAKTALFIGSGYWIKEYGTALLHRFKSALKRHKLTSFVTIIAFASLMGIPLLAGYNSKHLIKYGFKDNYLSTILLHLTSIITFLYATRFLWLGIFRDIKFDCGKIGKIFFQRVESNYSPGLTDRISLLPPVILLVVLGIFPHLLISLFEKQTFDFHLLAGLRNNIIYLLLASRLFAADFFAGRIPGAD